MSPNITLSLYLAAAVVSCSSAYAELTAAHEKAIVKIRADVRRAAGLFREKKWEASASVIASAREQLEKLPLDDPAVLAATKTLTEGISKAEQLLEKQGVSGPNHAGENSGRSNRQNGGRVSFTDSVASILQSKCVSCHGGATPKRGLRMESYAGLARGSQSGQVIQPGNPARSLLAAKLRGVAPGKRMPLDQDQLSEEQISQIETWIRQGAKFDGADPMTGLDQLSGPRKTDVPADELNSAREKQAQRHWKRAFPKQRPERVETDSFLLLGKLARRDLEHIADTAAGAQKSALRSLKLSETAASPGRITIFVLPDGYDYGEFGKMIEKRQLPREWRGHWHVEDDAGYIVLGPPPAEKSLELETQLALFVAAVTAKSWGTPEWFADGLGHVVAEKTNRRDPEVRTWKKRAAKAVRQVESGEALLNSQLSPEVAGLANWSIVRDMLQDPRRSSRLLRSISSGTDFETAFSAVYGSKPEDACGAWVRRNGGGKRRR